MYHSAHVEDNLHGSVLSVGSVGCFYSLLFYSLGGSNTQSPNNHMEGYSYF